jgi:hypothetical protein
MTRCPQERTARALVRFPVHRVEGVGPLPGAPPEASPLLNHVKASVSVLLKEHRSWNWDEQKLYHTVLLSEAQIRKGRT